MNGNPPLVAVMQGRLVPPEGATIQCFPRQRWRDEFPLAAKAGIDAIEWIYDLPSADDNPLATDAGLAEMRELSRSSGTAVVSVCADYFLERTIVRASPSDYTELLQRLAWLIGRCRAAGVSRVVLPFVDGGSIETAAEHERVVDILTKIQPVCESADVELHLETALDPGSFASLLERFQADWVRVTYDSGNSASLGYDVRAELAAYGRRIGSVHVKDRVRGGGTVPLGSGDADLPALFSGLASLQFDGDYVLQVARGQAGDEVDWVRRNRASVGRYLTR